MPLNGSAYQASFRGMCSYNTGKGRKGKGGSMVALYEECIRKTVNAERTAGTWSKEQGAIGSTNTDRKPSHVGTLTYLSPAN